MVKFLIDRKSILLEILKIEGEIKTMNRNPRFVKIKRNIDSIETRRFGARTVSVEAPDDMGTILELRNNSQEMKNTISRYREMWTDFDNQINQMIVRKTRLQGQLFERPQ
ncbi:hypothetical protein ES703_103602 [subsurface metagenome]|jgi:hypothetical protein